MNIERHIKFENVTYVIIDEIADEFSEEIRQQIMAIYAGWVND